MPTPLAPEPSERPSSSPKAPTPSEHGLTPPADNSSPPTVIRSLPSAESDESKPTIISSARKPLTPDLQHAASLIGRQLAHFKLLESVGVGGMAAVIKAEDLDLGRTVALKILPPDMATDPENISRFKQEGRAAARLDHENIARVYYCGEDQGLHFISFEFVEGDNLRICMEKFGGILPLAQSLHYLIQVTAGLSHAASRSVVHRDIKPSNIVITPEGKAKIVDMGLARNLDARTSNGQLTQSGVTLGTFDYISPEQALEPRTADCRSDIYSLGCTFYHVMAGRPPVPDGTAAKKLHCHQHVPPLDPRELNPDLPDELAAILSKMMAKDLTQRYQHPDHLMQHLLAVAERLNLPIGHYPKNENGHLYTDRPMPVPPTIPSSWIAVAVVVLIVGLYAITGGWNSSVQPLDSTPFWLTDKPTSENISPPEAKTAVPSTDGEATVRTHGPQEAQSTGELVSLLRQGASQIKLRPGKVYDLTRLPRDGTELPNAVFEGSELTLECERVIDPPTVRLLACPPSGRKPRLGSLTIRGPLDGSAAKVRLNGIRFEVVANEADAGQVGIEFINVEQLDVEQCAFVPTSRKGKFDEGPAALAIQQLATKENTPEARFDRCWFAPGYTGIKLFSGEAGQSLRATECAFGPMRSAVEVQAAASANENRRVADLHFESCSVLMAGGSVVEIGHNVPCRVTAGWCLFSNPESPDPESPNCYLVRQIGTLASETQWEGAKSSDASGVEMPNGYDKVLAYANGKSTFSYEDCKRLQIPIEDAHARQLSKHPWAEERPIKRLSDYPRQVKQALALDLKQEILRLAPDKNRNLLGTKHLPGARLYDLFPLESPAPEIRVAANIKIWQPELSTDVTAAPNVYRSLVKAIDDLKKGDVLLIRHDGPLEISPVEFRKGDTDITIRPDEDCQPVLIAKAPTLKKDAALFKLYGGQLVLENLQFRLKADRAPAIVSLPGGGQCTIKGCIATLEEGDELAVVALADPRGEMMMGGGAPEKWPTPRISFENTFVRGSGRLLSVLASRPFELKMKGCLVVLDGSLAVVEPSNAEHIENLQCEITLDRVTTFLTKSLLSERGIEKRSESKALGLTPVQIQATRSLFVPASEQATLINFERLDSIEQAESMLQWKNAQFNIYGFKADQNMLTVSLEDTDPPTRPERTPINVCLAKWHEREASSGEVNFAVIPASKRFDGSKPSDFEIKSIAPALKGADFRDFGAPVELLRKVSIED